MSEHLPPYPEARDGDRVVRLCVRCTKREADGSDGLCYLCADDDARDLDPALLERDILRSAEATRKAIERRNRGAA